jgi:hypothetical protein
MDPRDRWDEIDLFTLTAKELLHHLWAVKARHHAEDDPFARRALELRVSEIQRELAVRNVRETERQEGKEP